MFYIGAKMKYFVDFGCYIGKMIDLAIKTYRDCDLYIGFEPIPLLAKKLKLKYNSNPKVIVKAIAVDTSSNNCKFFLSRCARLQHKFGEGSTMFPDKATNNINKNDFIRVPTIDAAQFLRELCYPDNRVILKIDIEGKEYDVLEHLIKTGGIGFIESLFVEWHYDRIPSISKSRHDALVAQLNKLGFPLSGTDADAFDKKVR